MGSQPTPEEAANALQDISDRREQATAPDAHPTWTIWAFALAVLAIGVTSDLLPELRTPLLYALVAAALLFTFLPRWKRSGSALGYQRSPVARAAGTPARARVLRMLTMLGLIIVVAVGATVMRNFDVPYPMTIGSAVIVATMPLWRRLLDSASRAPKA